MKTRARTILEVESGVQSERQRGDTDVSKLTLARASCRSSRVVVMLKPFGKISLIHVDPGQAFESVACSAILHIHFPHPKVSRF